MNMGLPKISIITPSFNQGKYLEQTIQSVLNENYSNLEYIIIDGGSTDNSLDIIKKYSAHLTYWVSEKDNGQAAALNKGLKHCTGEIFNWINSDDYLEEGALLKVANIFKKNNCDVVAGAVCDFNKEGKIKITTNSNLHIDEYLKKEIKLIYHQPAVWLRLDRMKEIGEFREALHYCFDQEFMMRYLLHFDNVCYIEDVLAYFRWHETSKSFANAEQFFWDFREMYKQFYFSQKNSSLEGKAKRKYLEYEWPLLNRSINKGDRSRFINFSIALKEIFRDPQERLNRNSLGWLKHILFGPKTIIKND
jgi:glycosyltransferase involved in cell wall biosynthesis